MKLFFCHSTRDKPLVREFIRLLHERSPHYEPWIDEREILVAEDLRATVRSGVATSSFLIAFLSPNSIDSKWVRFELDTAYKSNITILPIVFGLSSFELPAFICERRYLVLNGSSEREIVHLAQELCENICRWLVRNDQFSEALKDYADQFQAAAIEEGHDAARISLELMDFMPKFICAVYFSEYAGIDSEHCPPGWLIACCNVAFEHFRTSELEADQPPSVGAVRFIKQYRTLVMQCFFLGYYALALRRPLVGRILEEHMDYDVGNLCSVFDKVKKDTEGSEMDGAIWNLGLRYMGMMNRILVDRKVVPESEEIQIILTNAMHSGFTFARAVERVASENPLPNANGDG